MGDDESKRLHVAFFPLIAPGHMIPMFDLAKLFASHNVKTTIITTPLNAQTFLKQLQTYKNTGPPINIETIAFATEKADLPQGVENFDMVDSDETTFRLLKATSLLKEPLEQALERCKPNCLVADAYLSFATDVAAKVNIPRLVFHGFCCFTYSLLNAVMKYEPQKSLSTDDDEEYFIIPHLPHEIKLTRVQLDQAIQLSQLNELMGISGPTAEANENKSYGDIVHSFYEVEPDYVDYYRNVMGKKSWHIGPVSLCNRSNEAKIGRGKDSSIDEHECLRWLDSKKPNSVVYISFGSLAEVSMSQLKEIALGLQASEQNFIWVVRRSKNQDEFEDWLSNGFEKRMEGKGLIIRGWAPQVLILEHEAVGAFVTHCGWNSTLEAISCGVPMVTWPGFADQLYNEKLVTEILKVGVPIGTKQYGRLFDDRVGWEDIKGAILRIMAGGEALEIKNRTLELKEMARKAVEEGGSSHSDLCSLIQELSSMSS